MRAEASFPTNVLAGRESPAQGGIADVDATEAARKARHAHALILLDQVCAPADTTQWRDALLAREPEFIDLLITQFAGLDRPLTVTVNDNGQSSFHAEHPFLDAAPLLKLVMALAPHAQATALKVLQAALAGSGVQSERMKLAEALLQLLAEAGAAPLTDAQRHAVANNINELLADPAIAWQDKRRFTALLPANAAHQAGTALDGIQGKLRRQEAGNSSSAPQDSEAQLAVAFYTGLFTGDLALASRALKFLRTWPGEHAPRLAARCMADHQALVMEAPAATSSGTTTESKAPVDPAETALHRAAARGDLQAVRQLLSTLARAPGQLNVAREDGCTPLLLACLWGHADTAKLLLDQPGIDVHARRHSDGATALFMAAAHGHLKIVEAFVARPDKFELAGMTPDIKVKGGDRWGALPISIAADNGHKKVVDLLQPLTPAAPPRPRTASPIVTDDTRCWSFMGSKLLDDSETLKSAVHGGSRKIALNFLGGKRWLVLDGLEWDSFVKQVRTSGIAGTRWFIYAHGDKWSVENPRHRLEFADGQVVGTNEAIRVLVEAGVRNIQIWSCRAKQAVKHLALRMACDPGWPQMHEPMEVTVIGEDDEASFGLLVDDDRERVMRDLARPEAPATAQKFSVMTRTTVRFDPAADPRISVHTSLADLDTIAARFPQLTPAEQKLLVRSYMYKCGLHGNAEELARTIAKFPQLADVNDPGRPSELPLLCLSAAAGHDAVVAALLRNGASINSEFGRKYSALYYAAHQGKVSTVILLLRHGAKTACSGGSAREIALERDHLDVVKVLDNWKKPARS